MGHYDYNSQIFNDYGICDYNTKNTTNGLRDKSICIIVMVVINVFYDYKCSHIGSYIFHIYRSEDEGEWKVGPNKIKAHERIPSPIV